MSLSQPKPVASGAGPSLAADRIYGEYDIFGNNNYQSTGDNYSASAFGMSGITFFSISERTNSGTYNVAALPPSNSANSNEQFASAPANMTLHFYSANGTEVANNSNLAAEVVRVQVWGL